MKQNFERILQDTLRWEGPKGDRGYVNDPRDPGGETYRGVTKRVYDAYRRGRGQLPQNVRLMSDNELEDIYRNQYWVPIRGDDLPSGVDQAVFDWAVNSGVVRASKGLQKACRITAIDGSIGLITLGRARSIPATELITSITAQRLGFMKQLAIWAIYGKGWGNRVEDIAKRATALAKGGIQ